MTAAVPVATGLALALLGQRFDCRLGSLDLNLLVVLDRCFPKWEDARTADLYARLKERLEKLTDEQQGRYFTVYRECVAAWEEHLGWHEQAET